MAVRVPWDDCEAAYLLSELIRVLNNEIPRSEAVKLVSDNLRKRALRRGVDIDDVFRNTNGITLQMSVMEYIYTEGSHGLKKPTMPKLFQQVVELYKSDKHSFEKLSKEAIEVPSNKSIEEQFYTWLSTQVSPTMLSDLYTAFRDINDFCLERKILKKPLFETIDLSILNNVRNTVDSNKVFRFSYKRQLSKMSAGMRQYISFVKSHPDLSERSMLVESETTETTGEVRANEIFITNDKLIQLLDSHGLEYVDLRSKGGCLWVIARITASSFFEECQKYGVIFHFKENGGNATSGKPAWWTKDTYKEPIDAVAEPVSVINSPNRFADERVYTIDFESRDKLPFTKPISVTYFGETISVENWTQAYVQAIKFLLEDYPDTFSGLLNKSIHGHGRIDLTDGNGLKHMYAAKMIGENLYLETNHSATDIVSRIRKILDICNVDYENLEIRYTKKEAKTLAPEEQRKSQSESIAIKNSDESEERVKFIEWMKNSGVATATILSYLSAVNQCAKALKEYAITEEELLTITDTNTLVQYRDELLTKTEFKKINEQQHNRFRSAFNKLIDYRSAGKPIKLAVAPPIPKPVKKEIAKIAIPDFSSSGTAASDPELEHFDAILREYFSEGLLPNALRLDKFRMLYEDEYGTEPSQDDDLLISKLKKAGSFIDGRIYPKQDTQQSNLLADMLTEIINTLNNGARCVYLSCVMERWQQDLTTHLSVYNGDTLRALLVAQKVPGLIITDNVLKATTQKVYPEENIISVMKESHYGMTYQQIQEKIWYIPLDEIKHTLVTTPEIVNVDAETYFYAPNFPASPVELQHLKMCMKSELEAKGYLVAQDIANIIHDKCHTIAINTVDYKDWAYRNILKYIFRDNFEFSGAVVSEKGKAIELWQVFRNYCRAHERISLDDLNTLKDELGVTIYWDTVQTEMVRINVNELVRRDLVHFDIDATDKVLDELCPGDYVALKDINLFLHFPAVEYPWNEFVLESYLQASKAFKLYHVSYANHGAFGVMVRTSSRFEDYRAVVVDMLAHNNEWKNAKQALELIVDKGYQARKRWTNFEQVTQEASLIREKLEAERM